MVASVSKVKDSSVREWVCAWLMPCSVAVCLCEERVTWLLAAKLPAHCSHSSGGCLLMPSKTLLLTVAASAWVGDGEFWRGEGGISAVLVTFQISLSLSLSLEEGKKAIGGRDRKQHRERLQTSSSGLV